MLHGWTSAVAIAVAVVAILLWDRRRRRDEDAADVAAQATYDARLFGAIVATVVLLAAALLLAGAGVAAGAWAAFVLVFVFIALTYVGPWLRPRRPRD
jgi:ABC-type xylose transport system permease subunit